MAAIQTERQIIYKNKIGPKIEPCGTTDLIFAGFESPWPLFTISWRLCR